MNETALSNLYEIASRKNGWLSKLQTVFGLDETEVGFLTWLDDEEIKMNRKVREMEAQMRREGFDEELIEAEDDDQRLMKLNKLIFTIEDQYEEMTRKDAPYVERMLALIVRRYEHWKKLRSKIRARAIHTKYPDSMEITEAEIIRAREVPLEELVELDRTKHMVCPFHDDKKPSMWVKNGYGWCFSCGAWCDSIRYLVDVKKFAFVDAVKRLNA